MSSKIRELCKMAEELEDKKIMEKNIIQTSEEYKKKIALKEMARTCPECEKLGDVMGCYHEPLYVCKCGCEWKVKND